MVQLLQSAAAVAAATAATTRYIVFIHGVVQFRIMLRLSSVLLCAPISSSFSLSLILMFLFSILLCLLV